VDLSDPQARRITGERAQRRAHRLRAGARCVVVGSATVLADRPRLNLRHLPPEAVAGPGPRAVVLDGRARCRPEILPSGALVLHRPGVTAPDPGAGREWAAVATTPDGALDWRAIDRELVGRGLGLALLEGGARVAASLLRHRPPQRIHLLVSPRRFPEAAARLDLAEEIERDYRRVRARRLGEDEERVYVRRDLPRGPGESAA
jgi:riboflavin biosynthesis pyrimidine reductase